MKIVAVDPGETTGIVVANWNEVGIPELVNSFTVGQNYAGASVLGHAADVVLIETPPAVHGKPNIAYLQIRDYLSTLAGSTRVLYFSPGNWKPIAKANEWRNLNLKTSHERDAYNLLRYWFWLDKKIDIGELGFSERPI